MSTGTPWSGIGWKLAGTAAGLVVLGVLASMIKGEARVTPYVATPAAGSSSAGACANCGLVVSIRILEVPDESVGVRSAVGAPPGPPEGQEAVRSATGLGLAGGALAGSEPAARRRPAYRVTVRMDDGLFRTVSLSAPPPFTLGDKVRVVEGKLVRG